MVSSIKWYNVALIIVHITKGQRTDCASVPYYLYSVSPTRPSTVNKDLRNCKQTFANLNILQGINVAKFHV